jgi:hypothetical protein
LTKKRVLDIPNPRRRTFWISEELDVALRIRAAKENLRFSDVAEVGLREYLGLEKKKKGEKK